MGGVVALNRRLFVAGAAAALLSGCATYAPTTATPFAAVSEADMLAAVNAIRRSNGRSELRFSTTLARAARKQARDMADRDALSHNFGPGLSLRDRVRAVGYHGPVGENVAGGQRTLEDALTGWMNSASHRSTLLSEMWTTFGMAVVPGGQGSRYGVFWAAAFGTS